MAKLTDKFPKIAPTKYDAVRGDIMDGDVLMCSGSGWFSKAIQSATGSDWSHVAFVYWWPKIDRLMVMESVESIGVRTVPLSSYLKDYNASGEGYPGRLALVRHAELSKRFTDKKKARLGQFAADKLGYNYDNGEIAKISVRILASVVPIFRSTKKELKHDNEYICSEFVHLCYKKIGVRVKHNPKGFIAPADFAKDGSFNLMCVLRK